jgi:hypothetical protein
VIGDPRDRTGYGIALASLGVALAIVLAGICWISVQQGDEPVVAVHGCVLLKGIHCSPDISVHKDTSDAPPGLWIALAGLAGVLVGALIPLPSRAPPSSSRDVNSPPWWLWSAIAALAAIASFVVAHDNHESLPFYVAAALLVGLSLGLLIPLPGQED